MVKIDDDGWERPFERLTADNSTELRKTTETFEVQDD